MPLKTRHCLGLLFIAVFGAYFNCLGNGLVGFDDVVVLHPQGAFGVAAVKRLPRELRKGPLRALSAAASARPLTGLSQMLDVALYGQDYWGHHLSSVVYHFLACCFAFLVAAALIGSTSGGLAAALVFALHPVQTESVAYLAGRRDVLCGLLCLASLYAWLRGLNARSKAATAAAVALWALALTAKPSAVALPLLWLAAAAALKPGEFKEHLARHLKLYLACAAACLAVALASLAGEAAVLERFKLPSELLWFGGGAASQWATEPRIALHALKLLAWPAALSADYTLRVFEPSRSFLETEVLLGLAACALLAGLAWLLRRKRPLASFALAWILLSYAPMLHLLPALHNSEVFAEHWLYLPTFGFALLLAGLLDDLQRWPRASWALFGVLLCLYAGRTAVRNRDWKDGLTLWSKTAATYPQCGRAQGILGFLRLQRGELEAAGTALLRARELRPDSPQNFINLAGLNARLGRSKDAERILLQARDLPRAKLMRDTIDLELDRLYFRTGQLQKARRPWGAGFANEYPDLGSDSLNLSGKVAAESGDAEMAEKAYVRVMALSPGSSAAPYNLGALHYTRRNFELAAHWFERALAQRPADLRARAVLGLCYAEAGRTSLARRTLELALKEDPRSVEVWLAVSGFHLKLKELPRALAAARQAARLEKSPRTDRQLYLVYRGM